MRRYFGFVSYEEAQKKALELLDNEPIGGITTKIGVVFNRVMRGRVAESFSKPPTTLFEKPIEWDEEDVFYYAYKLNKDTGETTGGRVFIYSPINPNIKEDFSLTYLTPEECNPDNYTLPFRNLTDDLLQRELYRFDFDFCKPTTPLSIDEALTPYGEELLSHFEGFDYNPSLEEQLFRGELSKENFFRVADEEVEEYPEDYPEEWKDNIITEVYPLPFALARATGRTIKNAKDYASAISHLLGGASLDEREQRAIGSNFIPVLAIHFLSYATYEFFRTEDYSHLQEILSHYGSFGLSKNWEKYLPYENNAVEAIIRRYLSPFVSSLLGVTSLKEISEATGIPRSLIYKVKNNKLWQ